ncbi:hypothetical protein RQP46_011152 [Phenoliferia psychrophenolica]
MAKLKDLASELLAKIHTLSTEGESAAKQQCARFSFGRVSRACYLATADATDFHVAGGRQAKALLSKLKMERKNQSQREREALSGRPNPWKKPWISTRVTNVRHLSISIYNDDESFSNLIQYVPDLIALELGFDQSYLTPVLYLPSLEKALGSLTGLQELRVFSKYLSLNPDMLLSSGVHLNVLDLQVEITDIWEIEEESLLPSPHFRELRICLDEQPTVFTTALLGALSTNSTAKVQTVNLPPTWSWDLWT